MEYLQLVQQVLYIIIIKKGFSFKTHL